MPKQEWEDLISGSGYVQLALPRFEVEDKLAEADCVVVLVGLIDLDRKLVYHPYNGDAEGVDDKTA